MVRSSGFGRLLLALSVGLLSFWMAPSMPWIAEAASPPSRPSVASGRFDSAGVYERVPAGAGLDAVSPTDIQYAHIIFSSHVDLGFNGIDPTPGYLYNVINKYFTEYFPAVYKTVAEMETAGQKQKFIYTLEGGSWLLTLYLNCNASTLYGPVICPSAADVANMQKMLLSGNIAWHAFPFNAEPELYDASMFLSSIAFAQRMDRQFSQQHSLVMSQRDVPGMTSSVIPLLNKAGVKAVSVGTNTASAAPAVPHASIWQDLSSGEETLLLYHPKGYGAPVPFVSLEDCVLLPNGHAFVPAWKGDNAGPPSASEFLLTISVVQQIFNKSSVFASTFENFVAFMDAPEVRSILPVVVGEIGDTWIYGAGSDSWKTKVFRAAMRARSQCVAAKACDPDVDSRMQAFDLRFTKLMEHTWARDVKKTIKDDVSWSDELFHVLLRTTKEFQPFIDSLVEQRAYFDLAMQSLGKDHPLTPLIEQELAQLVPARPDTSSMVPLGPSFFSNIQLLHGVSAAVDPLTGGLRLLQLGNQSLADDQHVLGAFSYQTYSQEDYDTFFSEYPSVPDLFYFRLDFGKPGVWLAAPKSTVSHGQIVNMWVSSPVRDSLVVELRVDVANYGAPSTVFLEYNVLSPSSVGLTVTVFNKTNTRLPEALWVAFNPIVLNPLEGYVLSKLDNFVDPMQVILNGSMHLHGLSPATDKVGVEYLPQKLSLRSLDAALVSVGLQSAFPTPFETADPSLGFYFNLMNNLWGTNYAQWYPFLENVGDENAKFRFILQIKD